MNYLYFKSLASCPIEPYDLTECVEWVKRVGNELLKEVFFAASWFVVILFLSMYKIISKLWLFLFSANLVFLWLYQSGSDLIEHGGINSFGILFLITLESLLISIIILIKNLWSRGRKWMIVITIILVTLPIVYYFSFIHNSWKGWENGYGGRKLINEKGYCTIVTPNYCELQIRNGWFDMNRFSTEWNKTPMTVIKESLPENLRNRKNMKRLGYPRCEYYSNEIRMKESKLIEEVDKGLIDMDDPSVDEYTKKNIEFIVDLSDEKSHILQIDVKRNNTRVEELKKIREKVLEEDKVNNNTERIDKDVLVIFIDNISRPNFHRKLKKTSRFFNRFANKDDSEYEVFEFFRYHSIETNTFRNYNALFYGLDGYLTTESKNVYQYFSQNGYITGIFFEEWNMMLTLNDLNANYSKPFHHFDHFPISILWDKNYDRTCAGTQWFGEGRNSPFERWLYGQTTAEIVLNYTTQFWDKYSDVRKYFQIWMILK